ncbi:MAG: hypothetical protein ACOYMZ_01445 [Minisyncoccia bacterium]
MKKGLYGIAVSALILVTFFGGSTAHAANAGQYYMVMMQEEAPKNCTVRQSDLGLGGGVFVAGTSFCEDRSPSVMMIFGALNNPYNNHSSYENDYSYDEEEYSDEYEEDYDDEEYDEDRRDEDEDDSDNDSDDNDSGSHSW